MSIEAQQSIYDLVSGEHREEQGNLQDAESVLSALPLPPLIAEIANEKTKKRVRVLLAAFMVFFMGTSVGTLLSGCEGKHDKNSKPSTSVTTAAPGFTPPLEATTVPIPSSTPRATETLTPFPTPTETATPEGPGYFVTASKGDIEPEVVRKYMEEHEEEVNERVEELKKKLEKKYPNLKLETDIKVFYPYKEGHPDKNNIVPYVYAYHSAKEGRIDTYFLPYGFDKENGKRFPELKEVNLPEGWVGTMAAVNFGEKNGGIQPALLIGKAGDETEMKDQIYRYIYLYNPLTDEWELRKAIPGQHPKAVDGENFFGFYGKDGISKSTKVLSTKEDFEKEGIPLSFFTSTPTPEPTETATPTPKPTERPVPKDVTRIPGLTLRFNAEKGYWQYLDSDGRPVAHFSQTEYGKRIEIDVDNLDFEKHPELRGLFEPATSAQLARFEKEAIKNDPWVFILPVPGDEVAELATIRENTNLGKYYYLGIRLPETKLPATIYSPISGTAKQGRRMWTKTDWASYFIVFNDRGKKAVLFEVFAADGNFTSLLDVPMGAKKLRQIGQSISQITNPKSTIPRFTHSTRITQGRGEYQIVLTAGSYNKKLWRELLNKCSYAHILRDPKTGKLLSIEVGKKTSMKGESNRRLASRQRKLAESQVQAAITSAKARGNWN